MIKRISLLLILLGILSPYLALAQDLRLEEKQLHEAIQRDDYDAALDALERGADPNVTDKFGYTALNYAAACTNPGILPKVVRFGGEYRPNEHKESPLLTAAKHGGYKQVMQLIQQGYNPNTLDPDGLNLMFLAVERDDPAMVQLCHQHKIPPNVPQMGNYLAIHSAASLGANKALTVLMEVLGLQPTTLGPSGWTPLHYAAKGGHTETIQLLVEAGANPNAIDANGRTPLHIAAGAGHAKATAMLIDLKAIVQFPDINKNFPIHEAAASGDLKTFYNFYNRGADLNLMDGTQQTPLKIAASTGAAFLCRSLIQNGASTEFAQLPEVWKYLIIRDLEALKALIKGEKDANMEIEGVSLLSWAISVAHPEAANFLLQKGAQPFRVNALGSTPLHNAARFALPQTIQAIQARYPSETDLSLEDERGRTPLQVAVEYVRLPTVKHLIDSGSNLNHPDRRGRTVLHQAAVHQGNLELLPMILDAGPDMSITDREGRTALHLAALNGNSEAVRLLVREGMPLDLTDANGNTPLHLAAIMGHSEIITHLISKGANSKIRNASGDTPLASAVENWHLEVLKWLPRESI